MTAQVVPLHPSALVLAREVIREADLHPDAVVLAACDTLSAHGDWIDQSRAKELRNVIVRETVERINARAAREQRARRLALCAALIAVGIFIGLHI